MIKKSFLYLSAVAFLTACNNNSAPTSQEPPKDSVQNVTITQPENELADFKFRTLVINIPSPFEIIAQFAKSGVPFKTGLVNPTDNVTKYTTSTEKAINYGVYVVDLVYLSSHEHYSDIKNYFETSVTLAKNLEFYESYANIVGARLENNIDKKDTINRIMDQVYTEMDNYLRSNNRLLTATHIIAGSWIESQYLTISLLKDENQTAANEALFQKVVEQSFTSKKLVDILKDYEKEKEFKPFIDEIKELDKLYGELHSSKDLTKEMLQKIHTKLSDIRTKMIN